MIFAHQKCPRAFINTNNDHWVLNMNKLTTAEIPGTFADQVKVSPNLKSFDFWTTNTMKFSQKKFHLRTAFINVSLKKNWGGAAAPPQAMKCQNDEINAELGTDFWIFFD